MSNFVLDASAVLAILQREPGAAQVLPTIDVAVVIAVNISEVVSKLATAGVPEDAVRGAIAGLGVRVVPFDEEIAYRAGLLAPITKAMGLSLGDRACLALAAQLDLPALTADRAWANLPLPVAVTLIR